ncbi:hypothetical protein [Bradyrhizobium sp. UFLA05-112]
MSLSITISNFSPAPSRRDQELALLVEALRNIEQTLRAPGGSVTSGSAFVAGTSTAVGTFTWTPQASS